jgi:transposase
MISQEAWMDIKLLARQGMSARAIARQTGLSRTTVNKLLKQTVPAKYAPRPPRAKKIDQYLPYLTEQLEARPWALASVLYRELVERGYAGHYEVVKVWVRRHREDVAARQRAHVRFETGPGVEGQFDWKGPIAGLLGSEPEKDVYVFRFVLGYSRFRVTRAVTVTTLPAILADLIQVFTKLGGVPRRLVFDNFKAAVLNPRPNLRLHPAFAEFCSHYGIEPAPALVRSPQRKGKVERAFLDLEQSELLRGTFPTLAAFQLALDVQDAAHAAAVVSTTGQKPGERLERERPFLTHLPATPFDPRLVEVRRVLSDCTISYRGARYSVPYTLVGKRLIVKADPHGRDFEVFDGCRRIESYPILPKGESLIVEEHIAPLRRARWDRVTASALKAVPSPATPKSLVPWPSVPVAQRSILEYAELVEVAR